MKRRILCVFLSALFLLILPGCTGGNAGTETGESSAPPVTEPDPVLTLTEPGEAFEQAFLESSALIYDKERASAEVAEAILTLKLTISEKYGVSLPLRDAAKDSDAVHEILIGFTGRPEGDEIMSLLRTGDYALCVRGGCLAAAGVGDGALLAALGELTERVRGGNGVLLDGTVLHREESILRPQVLLNGRPLSCYSVRIPAGNETAASAAALLTDTAAERFGYALPVVTRPADGPVIRLETGAGEGITVREDGDGILLAGGTDSDLAAAVSVFAEDFLSGTPDDGVLRVTVAQDASERAAQCVLTVLSWNIYNESGEPAGQNLRTRPLREEAVVETVRQVMPDVFMTQETRDWWVIWLMQHLPPEYAWAYTESSGQADDETNMAIFYRTDRLSLRKNGMFWPSDTPDRYSTYSGAWCTRIVTWAEFTQKSTGKTFAVTNVHLDGGDGVALKQAQVIDRFIAGYKNAMPLILGGDFNTVRSGSTETPYGLLTRDGAMCEAAGIAAASSGTARIDFMLVNPAFAAVPVFRGMEIPVINAGGEAVQASDHAPQLAMLVLK